MLKTAIQKLWIKLKLCFGNNPVLCTVFTHLCLFAIEYVLIFHYAALGNVYFCAAFLFHLSIYYWPRKQHTGINRIGHEQSLIICCYITFLIIKDFAILVK